MDIKDFQSYYQKQNPTKINPTQDRIISREELERLAGSDHQISAHEAQSLGIDPTSAKFINQVLIDTKQASAQSTVLLFDKSDQAIQVQRIGGALFNKVVTPADKDIKGISAQIDLPQLKFDPQRYFMATDDKGHALPDATSTGPLDRPSVYMGGNISSHHHHEEMDVGLTWSRVFAPGPNLRPTYTDQSEGCDGGKAEHLFVKTEAQIKTIKDKSYARFVDAQGKPCIVCLNDQQIVKDPKLLQELKALKQDPQKTDLVIDGNGQVKAQGTQVDTFMKSLNPNFAFRPYWRTTNAVVYTPKDTKQQYVQSKDKQGQTVLLNPQGKPVATGQKAISAYLKQNQLSRLMNPEKPTEPSGNQWNNPAVGTADNIYFYPGEKVQMSVQVTSENQVSMSITAGSKKFNRSFAQEKFGLGQDQQFKHVHSLDQFRSVKENGKFMRKGNENREFIPTGSTMDNIRWQPQILKSDGSSVALNEANRLRITAGDVAPYHTRIFTSDDQGQDIKPSKGLK